MIGSTSKFERLSERLAKIPTGFLVAAALVFVHAAISWLLYLNHALIPDELIFIDSAGAELRNGSGLHYLRMDNVFGYGALYWFIERLMNIFPDPHLAVRGFYWSLLVSSDCFLLAIATRFNRDRAAFVMLIYLTLPMVWWQGKITGPEPLSHFFFMASCFCAVFFGRNLKYLSSGVFFGLAVGVKLTALPLGFVLAALLWISEERREIKALLKIFMFFVVSIIFGFILANPYVLWAPQKLLSEYYLPGDKQVPIALVNIISGKNGPLWDAVPIGSLGYFGGSIALIGFLGIFSVLDRGPKIFAIGWILATAGGIFLSLRAPTFFGWYFYSQILVSPLLLSLPPKAGTVPTELDRNAFSRQLSAAWAAAFSLAAPVLLILFTGASAFQNGPIILEAIGGKQKQIAQMQTHPLLREHALAMAKMHHADTIVDFSEFGERLFTEEDLRGLEKVELVGAQESRKGQGFDWLWGFTQNYIRDDKGGAISCNKLNGRSHVLLLVGERLVTNRDIWQTSFQEWARKEIADSCPGWRIASYDLYGHVHFLMFENFAKSTFNTTLNKLPTFGGVEGWGRPTPSSGAVVGPGPTNPNVITQRLLVHEGEPLKVVVRASSVDSPTSTGRLQVNWVDAEEHMLGAALTPIAVGTKEKAFEMFVTPPPGTVAGYLYVTPHGPDDVVRYTEARMLTTP